MKVVYLIISVVASFATSTAVAGSWAKTNDSRIKEMKVDKKLVGVSFDIPHVSQPDANTCGATNMHIAMRWLFGASMDIKPIYDKVNTNGEVGIQMQEMLSGLSSLVTIQNGKNGNVRVNPNEAEYKDIRGAIKGMMSHMHSKQRPVIIVGNTDRGLPWWWQAGGHYYTPTRVIYDNVSKKNKFGLEFIDSVYKSPAGFSIKGVSPSTFISDKELATYWKPTGSAKPWLRKVRYITY